MNNEIIEIQKSNALAAYDAAREAGADSTMKVLEALFGEETFKPKDVTERIKTFEDACRELGDDHQFVLAYKELLHTATRENVFLEAYGLDMIAYMKLRIICAALNEGWIPQFISGERRYYPWFWLYTEQEIQDMDEEEKIDEIIAMHTETVEGLKAVGYGLLVLFFAMGVFQSAASFRDLQRPEYALRHFIRFIAAKVAVSSAMEIMTVIFSICGGIVQSVMSGVGGMASAGVSIPQEMVDAIENVGFLASIPLWLVSILGNLFITIMSFILIMTVYGRFFRIYIFTALAPLPLASFAGEGTSFAGKQFIKSYIGVCMEGAVIVLACLIFSAFMSSGSPVLDTALTPVVMAWQYIGETIFNMLVLVGLVKGAERIVKELFGL